jgi:hypothetical protein
LKTRRKRKKGKKSSAKSKKLIYIITPTQRFTVAAAKDIMKILSANKRKKKTSNLGQRVYRDSRRIIMQSKCLNSSHKI